MAVRIEYALTWSGLRRWFTRAGCTDPRTHTLVLVRSGGRLPTWLDPRMGEWCALVHADTLPARAAMRCVVAPVPKHVRVHRPWDTFGLERNGDVHAGKRVARDPRPRKLTLADIAALGGYPTHARERRYGRVSPPTPSATEYDLKYASTPALTRTYAERGIFTLV